MRLIDADALVIMSGLKPDEWNTPDERWRLESEFGLWIINAPTIEPKRGRWIIGNKTSVFDLEGVKTWAVRLTCSECLFSLNFVEGHTAQYRFCPQCGAKMENNDE